MSAEIRSTTGPPALPGWLSKQLVHLLSQRGHAWLLAGPSGLGQYSLALALSRAWLCDKRTPQGACGECGSCHAIDVRAHADLCVLMPESDMVALGWPLGEKAQSEVDDKKRKASKEIRVDAMRDAVEFSQRTSARGRGKVVLVFPAQRMNNITANALLKTLEEPPGDVKFVLATESAHQLLPTIRSRCLGHTMVWPQTDDALAWLEAAGLQAADAAVLLRASGGRPEDALAHLGCGRDPLQWASLPRAVARGDASVFKDWSAPQAIDALQKMCHDMLATKAGAAPRFFAASDLPAAGSYSSLTRWARALMEAARTMEHPFNSALMTEALTSQAQNAIN